VFVSGAHFQSSLTFAGKAMSSPFVTLKRNEVTGSDKQNWFLIDKLNLQKRKRLAAYSQIDSLDDMTRDVIGNLSTCITQIKMSRQLMLFRGERTLSIIIFSITILHHEGLIFDNQHQ